MKDDVEFLDIFDNDDKVKKEIIVSKTIDEEVIKRKKKDENKNVKKKKKVKTKALQLLFCGISALFILGCCVFYGIRLIKYYRIYNPKIDTKSGETLLANGITSHSEVVFENSGLYINAGNYIYKGDVNNNYIKFNNMLWRIVKINVDNTIDIILDDYVNILPWSETSKSFSKSDIYNYLNKTFLENIDKDMLVKNSYCVDKIEDLSNITCNSQDNDSYVRFLDVTSFLNSIVDKKSFLVKEDEIYWLNDYNDEKVWHTNGFNVSMSDANTFYEVRPVVKLKNSVTFKEGDGTIGKPYVVDKDNKITLGSIVMLGKDKWIVYDTKDNVKLMRYDVLDKQYAFDKESLKYNSENIDSVANYLNTTYLDSLDYKNLIINSEWYTGTYENSVDDIKKDSVKTKVGMPSLLDIKFDSKINGYYMLNSNNEMMYVYENPLRPSRVTSLRNIRPCIAISKDDASKLKYSNGVFNWEG